MLGPTNVSLKTMQLSVLGVVGAVVAPELCEAFIVEVAVEGFE